jgi:tRNA(Met) C34 N-acetyltransferase TmcA
VYTEKRAGEERETRTQSRKPINGSIIVFVVKTFSKEAPVECDFMGEHQRRKETPKKARAKKRKKKKLSREEEGEIINRNQKLIPCLDCWLRCLSETHREAKKKRVAEEEGKRELKKKAQRRISNKHENPASHITSRFDSFKLFDALHIHFNG